MGADIPKYGLISIPNYVHNRNETSAFSFIKQPCTANSHLKDVSYLLLGPMDQPGYVFLMVMIEVPECKQSSQASLCLGICLLCFFFLFKCDTILSGPGHLDHSSTHTTYVANQSCILSWSVQKYIHVLNSCQCVIFTRTPYYKSKLHKSQHSCQFNQI